MNYNCFYVYVYHNENNEIYYVGKGKGGRAYEPHNNIEVPTDKNKISIVSKDLTEIWAFALERRLIKWYGRKDKGEGILENKTNGGNGASGAVRNVLQPNPIRPICPDCNTRPCAPNYYRDGVRHWRTKCSHCIDQAKDPKNVRRKKMRWELNGYKKKSNCDLCGFRSKYSSQITVWHVNGNLNDSNLVNLKCVCLNCVEVVKRDLFTWRIGDLSAD